MTFKVKIEVILLSKKYVIFKDDDIGKDFKGLKKWIDILLKNNAKAAIGLIGKCLKNKELVDYLKTLDKDRIEIFCHGYSHSYLPFILHKIFGKNRVLPTEFNRNFKSHDRSLKNYRELESKYLPRKAIAFGPPGNQWNDTVIDALLQNDFKLMFSWIKANRDILTIPISNNLKQNSLEEFIKVYEQFKDKPVYLLQFHHANLSEKQFKLIKEVIDFLKNEEKRIFITPSEILELSKKNKTIFDYISP